MPFLFLSSQSGFFFSLSAEIHINGELLCIMAMLLYLQSSSYWYSNHNISYYRCCLYCDFGCFPNELHFLFWVTHVGYLGFGTVMNFLGILIYFFKDLYEFLNFYIWYEFFFSFNQLIFMYVSGCLFVMFVFCVFFMFWDLLVLELLFLFGAF